MAPISESVPVPEIAPVEEKKQTMAEVPESVPAISESVPAIPESVPAIPESVPVIPELVPTISESVPVIPESVPTIPESVPAIPESAPAPEIVPVEKKEPSLMIRFSSNDGQIFSVSEEVARMFKTIDTMLLHLGVDQEASEAIPLNNVNGEILRLIIQWAEHHVGEPEPVVAREEDEDEDEDEEEEERQYREIPEWDVKFFAPMDNGTLFDLITAANFLDIKDLHHMACKTVANMMVGKKVEEIRKEFNIVNDFTPEEEAEIRKKYEWTELK